MARVTATKATNRPMVSGRWLEPVAARTGAALALTGSPPDRRGMRGDGTGELVPDLGGHRVQPAPGVLLVEERDEECHHELAEREQQADVDVAVHRVAEEPRRLAVVCWIRVVVGMPLSGCLRAGAGDDQMSALPAAPGLLEEYAARFDDLFSAVAQRRGFREYLTGLLA